MKPVRVTIVIVTWNRRAETLACLASLASADLGGARVLVVDNGSHDGSADAIRTRFPDVQLVGLPENRGYAGGCNAGIRSALNAGAEGVLLLNNEAGRTDPATAPPGGDEPAGSTAHPCLGPAKW